MPYGESDLTQVMGIGGYVGEVREAPDGQLYEWVEGVDGLGNPLGWGFWKKLKKFAGGVVRRALPFAAAAIPGFSLARRALRFASPLLRRALPFARYLPGVGPAIHAAGRVAQRAGLFGIGDVGEGPDGQLYEVVEGIGEFGERRPYLRRVWLSVPATIRPRGQRRAFPPRPGRRVVPAARPFVQTPRV